ncbi:aminotransferase class I/II-fold pyridoxal phosphate-dependent enzyme [Marinilabilia rubra]|uniref:Aminotransferase n=1 Tax=Marinilabilia rubra TaxID=2162893 RepID=A0A2U2B5R8_9BACT|nr:aminotransferase class I/II-fold pyridoxal phosphate-dependent enzyme [Marinilabilia rubra]PWD98418.1 pyridoxal phosphate-dependent class II aminotransferase [Marinilabilia rubra]
MIKGHGDDIYDFPDIRINFSSNVIPSGLNSALKEYLCLQMKCIERYPEPLGESLASRIEDVKQLPVGSAMVTNGAVEAFYLIAELFQGRKSLIFYPSFSEYEDACRKSNHKIESLHHTKFEETDYSETDLVWICNPNNPDGRIYDKEKLLIQIVANPSVIFVVDEAYSDFLNTDISLETCLTGYKNLIIVKSLTKNFAIPGLRLGYLLANPFIIDRLQKQVMPWRINALALEAGRFCFSNLNLDKTEISKHIKESLRLQNEIKGIDGFNVVASLTTFFLVETPVLAADLKEQLAHDCGILIRDASNFKGLSDSCFRISVQSHEENNQLIEVLKEWS